MYQGFKFSFLSTKSAGFLNDLETLKSGVMAAENSGINYILIFK